jgi:hypothetical protein
MIYQVLGISLSIMALLFVVIMAKLIYDARSTGTHINQQQRIWINNYLCASHVAYKATAYKLSQDKKE